MSQDPLTGTFWSNEEAQLYEMLLPLIMDALLAGAAGGVGQLPINIADQVDWARFDALAQEFLLSYRLNELAGINITTMHRVINEILEWRASGEPPTKLRDRLQLFALSLGRAEMIAVTEVTRLFMTGNLLIWKATALIAGKTWKTAMDERVCQICAPLHNEAVGILDNFSLGISGPPAHPRCRCWISPEGFLIPTFAEILGVS